MNNNLAENEKIRQYVHGYTTEENQRLQDQAKTLTELLHSDTAYPASSFVLEAGCGVGAQTITLATNNPHAKFLSIDISQSSIEQAQKTIAKANITNVSFEQADIFNLSYNPETFDHIFVCFVLEHLPQPTLMLKELKKYLKPGGTITVIEGDHGSAFFHPASNAAQKVIDCQIALQQAAGGNAMAGRQLYPMLIHAGYNSVQVSPRMVYADSSNQEMVDGFTRKTFTAMIEGVKMSALQAGIITPDDFEQGIKDLRATTKADGVFCYTFFKAVAKKA